MIPLVMELPFPPSANRLWRAHNSFNGKPKFYRDGRYVSWLQECDCLCMANKWRKQAIRGHFKAEIVLSEAKRLGHIDGDNRIKGLLDWCQRAGLIDDDALADGVAFDWGLAPTGCRLTLIAIEPQVEPKPKVKINGSPIKRVAVA